MVRVVPVEHAKWSLVEAHFKLALVKISTPSILPHNHKHTPINV
jgi:hypothetical protein